MKTIEVKDVGPVSHLKIELPKSGVCVLRGKQGSGKSTILKGVGKALGGDARGLSPQDGAKRGTIEIGEAKLSITQKRQAVKGEVEVTGIESRIDIAALVDPGIIDPERADAARIKALVQLKQVSADPSAYYKLVGGQDEFDKLGVDTDTDDPVLLCKRIKSAIESRARKWESDADEERGKAAALTEHIKDVEIVEPPPQEELRATLDVATQKLADAKAGAKARADAEDKRTAADLKLAELGDSDCAIETTRKKLTDIQTDIKKLQQILAKQERAEAELKIQLSEEEKASEQRKILSAIVESAMPDKVTDESIALLTEDKESATKAVEQAEAMRGLIVCRDKIDKHTKSAELSDKQADKLRRLATKAEQVLASQVPLGDLRIEGGRLVMATDRSKSELYAELSHGERWMAAIDVAVQELGDDGLLVIPQEAWEGIQDSNREIINEHAKKVGVVILTAEVSNGELEVV